MHITVVIVLFFTAATFAENETPEGYHQLIGMPLAHVIKYREDRIHKSLGRGGESQYNNVEDERLVYSRGGGDGVFGQNNSYNDDTVYSAISTPETFPFFGGIIVHFVDTPTHSVCGSSLISSKRLVTAAHCWDDGHMHVKSFTVVLGSEYIYYGGLPLVSSDVITHPNYDHQTLDHDIAIIYLENRVYFTRLIFPIALPEGEEINEDYTSHTATGFGFGGTDNPDAFDDYGDKDSSSVRVVPVEIISNVHCSEQLWYPAAPFQLCSSGVEGKRPCLGNSGGPLITYTRKRYALDSRKILVGITSYMAGPGPICAGGKPNVFTHVGKYMDFISQHVKIPKYKFYFNVGKEDGSHPLENITVTLTGIE